MADLFLIVQPGQVVHVLRPSEANTWEMCRRPVAHRAKAQLLRQVSGEWVIQDTGERNSRKAVLYRPAEDAQHQSAQPPLGMWRNVHNGEELMLTDQEPLIDDPVVFNLDAPFVDVRMQESANVVRIEASLNRNPIGDNDFDDLLRRFREILLELVKRPRVIVVLSLCLQDSPVPTMRVVKKFLNFAGENAWLMDHLVRGIGIILKPQGFTGYAILNIVKMVLRAMPAPWQTKIVPTEEEAREFMDSESEVEAKVLAKRADVPALAGECVEEDNNQAAKDGITVVISTPTTTIGTSPASGSSSSVRIEAVLSDDCAKSPLGGGRLIDDVEVGTNVIPEIESPVSLPRSGYFDWLWCNCNCNANAR